MIRFACPGCSATFTVTDDKAGKTSNCPKCKSQFLIPGEAPPPLPPSPPKQNAPITIEPCPKCKTQLSVDPADLGTDVECPTCQRVFRARKPGTKPSVPAVTKSRVDSGEPVGRRRDEEDDDDRPMRRSSARRDDDDDDDDRPVRRRSSRRDEEDDEDDRPRRRSSRRDDDDFDRPRRKPKRFRGNTSEGQGVRVTSAVMGFILGGFSLICGIGFIVAGSVVVDAITGLGRGVAKAPPAVAPANPPGFPRGFPGNPRPNVGLNPNAQANNNAAAGAAIAGAGWLTGGVVIGCGVVALLFSGVYIGGGIGLLQLRTYGRILTIIAAVFSGLLVLLNLYSLIGAADRGVAGPICITLVSVILYATHSITSFMGALGAGSHNFR